jgi:hypothetical protein
MVRYKTVQRFKTVNSHTTVLVTKRHRWARLLEQQSPTTVYRLPTKENKLPFSVSDGSK